MSTPLLPGRGNRLRWADLGAPEPGGDTALVEPAWSAFLGLLERWQPQLRIDLSEVTPRPRVTVSANGTLIQIHAPRVAFGLPVRGAELTAVLSHGNLVLLGLNRWGDVAAPPAAAIDAERARLAVAEHLRPFAVQAFAAEPHLELIPLAKGTQARWPRGTATTFAWPGWSRRECKGTPVPGKASWMPPAARSSRSKTRTSTRPRGR